MQPRLYYHIRACPLLRSSANNLPWYLGLPSKSRFCCAKVFVSELLGIAYSHLLGIWLCYVHQKKGRKKESLRNATNFPAPLSTCSNPALQRVWYPRVREALPSQDKDLIGKEPAVSTFLRGETPLPPNLTASASAVGTSSSGTREAVPFARLETKKNYSNLTKLQDLMYGYFLRLLKTSTCSIHAHLQEDHQFYTL